MLGLPLVGLTTGDLGATVTIGVPVVGAPVVGLPRAGLTLGDPGVTVGHHLVEQESHL